MFDVIVHADWSTRDRGRWAVSARRIGPGWRVGIPAPVGDLDRFRDGLVTMARGAPVLAGFDIPLGVPTAYGVQTGLNGFRDALASFGSADGWEDFYRVAATIEEIGIRRPFFPAGSGAGQTLASLAAGLGLASADELLRACERGSRARKRASALFWTVGAAQVGRAAMVGWRQIVGPALRAGAALWPFDGTLEELAAKGGLVLVETYPADAYAAVGAPFRTGESKRRQADRSGKADPILRWAEAHRVDLAACAALLRDGFGAAPAGEDPFDALLGLLAMIPIVEAPGRAMSERLPPDQAAWEGWILGR